MLNASDTDVGICSTWSSNEEVRKEARWGVRGVWIKYTGGLDIFERYRPEREGPEDSLRDLLFEDQKGMRMIYFVHLFSDLKRRGDMEWHLKMIGAKRGMEIVVFSLCWAYGADLAEATMPKRLKCLAQRRRFRGAHNGSPCFTWSRVRFLPGGPPPLGTRKNQCGRAKNSREQQAHTDLHSKLGRNSMFMLE